MPDGYVERHHVIPRSLGGSNKKSNLVALTYREHFICHWLLTKFTEGVARRKMQHALWRMTTKSKSMGRPVSGGQYSVGRRANREAQIGSKYSEARKGETELARYYNSEGGLLFVGAAVDTEQRNKVCRKFPWWPLMVDFTIEEFPTLAAALIAKTLANQNERPLYNAQGNSPENIARLTAYGNSPENIARLRVHSRSPENIIHSRSPENIAHLNALSARQKGKKLGPQTPEHTANILAAKARRRAARADSSPECRP